MAKKGNLLILEDEEEVCQSIKFLLQDIADNFFITDKGSEAIKLLSQEEIHCVISDISMPSMKGDEFIKLARQEGFNTPIIFFTGHGNEELMMKVMQYAAFDFINKPDLQRLEESVQSALKEGLLKSSMDSTSKTINDYEKMVDSLQKKSRK